MQFRVPQFIDLEDKVVGPLTLKQFGYLVAGGGFSFLAWTFIPLKFLAIIVIIPIMALFLALAFYKYNNRPFIALLESAFSYYTNSRLFVWKQPTPKLVTEVNSDTPKQESSIIAPVNQNKLHDIAIGLDVDTTKTDNTQ